MKIGITGHQRLRGEDSWEWVRHELAKVFAEHANSRVQAYSSLAIGADQEFASLSIDAGATLRVIVPCSGYERTFKTPSDLDRYLYLLSKASSVELLDYPQPCEDAFMAAGEKIAHTVDRLVAVWNGEQAAGTGGTDDAVAYALSCGTLVIQINPVARTVAVLPTVSRAGTK